MPGEDTGGWSDPWGGKGLEDILAGCGLTGFMVEVVEAEDERKPYGTRRVRRYRRENELLLHFILNCLSSSLCCSADYQDHKPWYLAGASETMTISSTDTLSITDVLFVT